MSDLWVTVSLLGNDGFILLGKYQPIFRVPRTHEWEYNVRVDELCCWGLDFPPQDDASIGHHTPSITLFACSSSRAKTLIKDPTGLAQVTHYPETRVSPGGHLHRAWSFGIRPGRHAHEPGSSSASCCCNGSVGKIETHVSDMWKCGSWSFIVTHPPEKKKRKRKKMTVKYLL